MQYLLTQEELDKLKGTTAKRDAVDFVMGIFVQELQAGLKVGRCFDGGDDLRVRYSELKNIIDRMRERVKKEQP